MKIKIVGIYNKVMGRTEWRGFDIIFHPTCKLKVHKSFIFIVNR